MFFFFNQKTAYEMRISDWSSDVCSSDLALHARKSHAPPRRAVRPVVPGTARVVRAAAKLDGVSTGARAIADPPVRDADAPADATLDAFLAGVGPRAFQLGRASCRAREGTFV